METDDTIITSDTDNYIWIKKYSLGLAGNHHIIYLTTISPEVSLMNIDTIFKNAETIFYRLHQDTLHIYSRDFYEVNPLIL